MFNQICSDFLKRSTILPTYLCSYRKLYETHYEVLNIPTNSTAKDIKRAFIQLSKEQLMRGRSRKHISIYLRSVLQMIAQQVASQSENDSSQFEVVKHHPDVNKSKQAHARFLKINEAYKVLSKPGSRRNYDLGLTNLHSEPVNNERFHSNHTEINTFGQKDPWSDPSFWMNRDKTKDNIHENHSYYGIRGVKKISNGAVVLMCILFALVGVSLQYLAVTHSVTLQRTEMIRRSREVQESLDQTRALATANGNAKQMEILKLKLLGTTSDN